MRQLTIAAFGIASLAGTLSVGTASASSTPVGDGFSITDAVSELPASVLDQGGWMITVADLNEVTELSGLTRPTTTLIDELYPWLNPITGFAGGGNPAAPVMVVPPEVFGLQYAQTLSEVADDVGWTMVNVDTFASVEAPPERFTTVTGAFDESTFGPGVTPLGNGVFTFGEGDDLSVDLLNRNAISPLGTPQRMAVADGTIAVSALTPLVTEWLAGGQASVLDNSSIAAAAASLDVVDAPSALIVPALPLDPANVLGPSASPESVEAYNDLIGDLAEPLAVSVIGIGWNADADGPLITVHYPIEGGDIDHAAEVIERVWTDAPSIRTTQPFSELFTVDGINMVDNTVTITLRPVDAERGPRLVSQMWINRELPFILATPA